MKTRIGQHPNHLWAALLLSGVFATSAQILPFGGGTYLQSFDGLPPSNAGAISASSDGPFRLDDLSWQTNTPPASWTTSSLQGWNALENGGSGFMFFGGSDGNTTVSGLWAFSQNPTVTDRALGAIAGSVRRMVFGLVLQNVTGVTINSVDVSFWGEQWRLGRNTGTADTLFFEYRVGLGSDITTAGGAFTVFAPLHFVTPITTGTVGALNGNDSANRVFLSNTLSGLNWQPGEFLVLRWRDITESGANHGIAIDDLRLYAIPEPATVGLLALGALAMIFGRRFRG